MAATQTPSIHNTETIRIIKIKGTMFMWVTIYADDIAICDIFGEHSKTHFPNIIISTEEETINTPSYTERTPKNAE